jgi:phosphotransferase system enzyme I (PtsI)
MKEYRGIAASPGIAVGPVFNYVKQDLRSLILRDIAGDTPAEAEALDQAFSRASSDIQALVDLMEERERYEEVEVFSIQLEFLEDPSYGEEIRRLVKEEAYRAAHAVEVVSEQLSAEFSEIEDEYFQGRIADIQDLARRLLSCLFNAKDVSLADISEPSVIVADDLTPTDTAHLVPGTSLAIVTRLGSATSHTAILSRGLGIPSVVGLGAFHADDGTRLVVDGSEGLVIADPDKALEAEYQKRGENFRERQAELRALAADPAVTSDGETVEVAANIGNLGDVTQALENGADGVGLFRSEFLFLERPSLPGEDEQYAEYREIFTALGKRPVVVRTLDVGGDKQLPSIEMPDEQNPFLGERAVRLALAHPEKLLYPQLRAILRAGLGCDLRIMFPMIAHFEEFLHLKQIISEITADLTREGIEHNGSPQLGIMIEIPSAAVAADLFAPHVDFFSIGTNDLTQYTLAADRTNERVAPLADYFQPAVIRLIDMVIQAAHARERWVGMCGEMAGDPAALPILLRPGGLGLDEFSMAPVSIPVIKHRIRNFSRKDLTASRDRILAASSADQLRKLSDTLYSELIPE